MNDDIIRMAREAWGEHHEIFWFDDNGIARFADIVRADERERIAAEWDGCMYGDLEDVDIGAAIRTRSSTC